MMTEILIPINDDERAKVLAAINGLNSIEHVTYMSLQAIADRAGLKITKVRHIIENLMQTQLIKRYNVSEKQVRPRYYYVLTDAANNFLHELESKCGAGVNTV